LSHQQDKISGRLSDFGPFLHPERARRDLEQVESRLSAGTLAALLHLLAESPDPDQALSLVERLLNHSNRELIALLDRDHVLLHYAILIFGHTYWLGEALIKNPDVLFSVQRDKHLERSVEPEDFLERLDHFCSHSTEKDDALLLARFKKREYIRIALRDLLGIATLADTTSEISALADVLIGAALEQAEAQMRRRYGSTVASSARFAVLALGKLGGNELNYSSDVDLLYLFSGPELSCGEVSLREYAIRLAQLVTDMLSRATPEGAIFRIDLRLRPRGHEGEPAIALPDALNYYAHAAADWELQTLIKARHSAGDRTLARDFISGVQARVYTPHINFSAIETAVNSRDKIDVHRRRSIALRNNPGAVDVKLDRGGIRDIEFLVQCLQRVYGGEERWLHASGTLFSLQKLNDRGHLDGHDFHQLGQAYEFLRVVEHRLQLQRGQQIHSLPGGAEELAVPARAVLGDSFNGKDAFMELLRAHMARVAAIYDRIIHKHERQKKAGRETPENVGRVARQDSLEQMLERVSGGSKALSESIRNSELSAYGRRNLHRFLSAAVTTAERQAVLLENPAAIEKALPLFETSDYLTDVLARHPDVIRVLGGFAQPANLSVARDAAASDINSPDLLRKHYREASFAIAARDVVSPRPAFESMRENSRLAESAIECAMRVVHGEQLLAVFALGRLGTDEFDIASDADLLFVRAPEADEQQARIHAERLVNVLSAYTKEGSIFAVDARLRPRGAEGELVVSTAQIDGYLAKEAQPWEALTYSKLRFVAGRKDLAPPVLTTVWRQIVGLAARPGFSAAVMEMRGRLEKSNRYANSFKLARGGFYDIDFIASYLMLREANLASGNTLERLDALCQSGSLDATDLERLREATLLYRAADHVIRLVTGRARPELPVAEHARQVTEKMVGRILGTDTECDLQSKLRETQEQVRLLFTKIVGA
jgi:[glutamine synthetase] adenylyltransferase / [glutamine synthetase]-adenylyl-L-tyrosine phosphorylase